MNNLRADGGHDHPEYALDAMLEALQYSFVDEYGDLFTPMSQNSKMVVITDATSKNQSLERTVIDTAIRQGVAIHFILGDYSHPPLRDDTIYPNIAAQTGGTIHSDETTTWSIINFQWGLPSVGTPGKRKRSSPVGPSRLSFNVSVFTGSIRLTAYTPTLTSGDATLTTPNGTSNVLIQDSVLLYLNSDPPAGNYSLAISVPPEQVFVQQDTSLDASMFYMDSSFTRSDFTLPPACKLELHDVLYKC